MAYRCRRQPSIGPRERSSFSGIASLKANLAWLRLVFVEGIGFSFSFSRFRFRFRWASRRTYKAGLRKRTSKRMYIQVEGDVSCCTRLRELIRSADDTRGSSPPRISHWKVISESIFTLKEWWT